MTYLAKTSTFRMFMQSNMDENVVTVAQFDDVLRMSTYLTVTEHEDGKFSIHRTAWLDSNPVEPISRQNYKDVSWAYVEGYAEGFIKDGYRRAERYAD